MVRRAIDKRFRLNLKQGTASREKELALASGE